MGYGIISEVGTRMADILCREMVPDVIPHSNQIGLCSPGEHGNFRLGISLYDISENEDVVVSGMVNTGLKTQTYPPIYLTLHYMITAYSGSDIKFRAREEHRILGRVIQVFRDYDVLTGEAPGDGAAKTARIELERLKRYEKMRMWNVANVPYRLSLFYRVRPVEIPSARTREMTRVRDVDYTVEEH